MILVTGGAGYIGSHFVLSCRDRGKDVVVLDDLSTGVRAAIPDDVPFYEGDCGDPQMLEDIFARWPIKSVVHFAARSSVPESVERPIEYYRNNTVASFQLINACCTHGIENFVFSSTAAVYGAAKHSPVSEKTPVAPVTPYGRTKLAVEHLLQDVANAGELKIAILRYFNVAGADPSGRAGPNSPGAQHLIKKVCRVATDQEPVLEMYGDDYDTPDGTCVRDFIHVTDLCQAHFIALSHLENGEQSLLLNCGNENGISVREIVNCTSSLLDHPLPNLVRPRRVGDVPSVTASCNRLKALGWSPKFSDINTILKTALRFEYQSANPPHAGMKHLGTGPIDFSPTGDKAVRL